MPKTGFIVLGKTALSTSAVAAPTAPYAAAGGAPAIPASPYGTACARWHRRGVCRVAPTSAAASADLGSALHSVTRVSHAAEIY
eukprot:COSAG01_NODE_5481_length_4231_cov_3.053969_1_plen_84_part_00